MPIDLGEIVVAVLHDEDGNPIDSVLDGATRRLAVDAGAIAAVGTTGDFDSAAEDETQTVQLVRAAISGQDSSAAAGSQNVPVEARALNNISAISGNAALIAINTVANAFARDAANARQTLVGGSFASAISGVVATTPFASYSTAIITGIDNTGAAVLEPIDAASTGTTSISPTTPNRLYVDSQLRALRGNEASLSPLFSSQDLDGSNTRNSLATLIVRESGFWASFSGRRFTVTTPAGTAVTGTTSFTATAPQFLLEAGATNDIVIRNFTVFIETAAGADPVRVHIVIDPDARFSSGGTSRTAANMNTADATAFSAAQVLDGAITATAADGDERDVLEAIMTNSIGTGLSIDFKDGLIIGVSDTFLVYVQGGSTAPDFTYSLEAEDANVQ